MHESARRESTSHLVRCRAIPVGILRTSADGELMGWLTGGVRLCTPDCRTRLVALPARRQRPTASDASVERGSRISTNLHESPRSSPTASEPSVRAERSVGAAGPASARINVVSRKFRFLGAKNQNLRVILEAVRSSYMKSLQDGSRIKSNSSHFKFATLSRPA